ncbi:MAG: CusA/CzcA family heavy metal efflux RND transporter [Candidatus Aminicenantes bacterium]|nr:CusA/CzcA family heavy metal efflux RND transporter [Candidatus Aminicenantes bacterium]
MIEKIIEWSAHNRFFVFIGVVVAIMISLWCLQNVPLDAIPDLSDTQVIILTRWDRPPDIIEDQVTYPLVTALLGAPKVKDIRGFSDYGFSYIYIIFEDGTDVYWARSRVLEYLTKVTPLLPPGVKVELGPDATGLGWVFQYALIDRTGQHSLEKLRSFQDWHLRYTLQSVKGVAEVATVGGFVRQYQVILKPEALLAYGISIKDVVMALRMANNDVGARLIEFSDREYMVSGRGYIKSKEDIEQIGLKHDPKGVPIRIKEIARVVLGPDIRRGVAELDGQGEVVGGIVVMRYGENALEVIKRVKERLGTIQLPAGVELVTTYDRSDLILRSINTLKTKLIEEMLIVSLIIFIFLWHWRSALVPIFTLPLAVLLSFIPMYYLKITSNIMSLGGIAIAIGAMVDATIVLVENTHKRLETWIPSSHQKREEIIIKATKEVGRPIFFSLLVIAVSFLPIFALEAYEGRLFKPLAYTKNLAMLFAAFVAIIVAPALIMFLVRGKIHPEEHNPVSRFLFRLYEPAVRFVLRRPVLVVLIAFLLILSVIPVARRLGSEFMPPLNEGSILYMPTTLPGLSVTEATRLLQIQDRLLRQFPEVERVFGKVGRAETATDPAPFSMIETTIWLKPQNEWRHKERWYSKKIPKFLQGPLRIFWPDRLSWEELVYGEGGLDETLRLPGVVNAWTMPIKGRIDMLTTGIRTPIGIKIYGDDLVKLEEIGIEIEQLLSQVPGTKSVYAERAAQGYFLDIWLRRDEIARYGLKIEDVQMELMVAVGGENITQTIEGRERYPINVRYPRELRDDLDKLKKVYISTPMGTQIPLGLLAEFELKLGPGMIRDENGHLASYVYVDFSGRDIASYVKEIKFLLNDKLKLPAGYSILFSGQYEYLERVNKRLRLVVPLTLFIILILLYLNTRSFVKTLIVLLAIPFSLIGAFWFLYLLGYNLSIGVWAGLIALLGVDAETGVIMLLYLDLSYKERKEKGLLNHLSDLKEAIIHGAVKRVRPKMMTVGTTFMGLLPIMLSQVHETGAEVMKRIAAPMVGGIFTSFVMELLVYPAIFFLWKRWTEMKIN